MFALWGPVDDSEIVSQVKSGADTAIVVNTAAATSVFLYSFIMTLELLGLTFLHGLVPHLVRLQRNKVLYIIYHTLYQSETISVSMYMDEREGQGTKQKHCCTRRRALE